MTAHWKSVKLKDALKRVERYEQRDGLCEYTFAGTYSFARGVFVSGRKQGSSFKLPKIQRVKAGDFVYCKIMAWEGAFGTVPPEADNCVMSGAFVAYEIDTAVIEPKFLDWYFRTPANWGRVGRQSTGTNVRRQSLDPEQFESSIILCPPLAEQRRIVAHIEELVRKVNEARGLRNASQEELSALQLSKGRSIFEALAGQAVPLESVCSAIIDNLHSNPLYVENGTVPCVRSPDVGYGTLDLDNTRRTDEAEYARRTIRGEPKPDDIVLVREGGGTGKCALVQQGQRFSLGQRVMMIRPNQAKVRPKFFLYQILSPTIQEDHISVLSKGSAAPHLNIGALRRFPFALPQFEVQDSIVAELDALQAQVDSVKALQSETAAELNAMLPAILDKAFKGEL